MSRRSRHTSGDPRAGRSEADTDLVAAIAGLVGHTGAEGFQLRYSDDEQPVVWMAVGTYPGGRAEADAGLTPGEAAWRLGERLVDGGTCQLLTEFGILDLPDFGPVEGRPVVTVHLERLPRGINPGGLYVRSCTSTDEVLVDHPMHDPAASGAEGDSDGTAVRSWLDGHPEGRVYTYIYDGDTGECVKTIIVRGDENRP